VRFIDGPPMSWYDPPDDDDYCEEHETSECSCFEDDGSEAAERQEQYEEDRVRSYHDSFGPTGGPWV